MINNSINYGVQRQIFLLILIHCEERYEDNSFSEITR